MPRIALKPASAKSAARLPPSRPIAVGVVLILFAGLFFGNWVNMSIGMLVHEASILVVIINGMRLMGYRQRKGIRNRSRSPHSLEIAGTKPKAA